MVEDEASQRGRWDQASLQLIQESTRRCPRCLVPVERNGKLRPRARPFVHQVSTEGCLCLPLQAAACTCSAPNAERSGAGSAAPPGTGSAWGTTGSDRCCGQAPPTAGEAWLRSSSVQTVDLSLSVNNRIKRENRLRLSLCLRPSAVLSWTSNSVPLGPGYLRKNTQIARETILFMEKNLIIYDHMNKTLYHMWKI